MAKKLCDDLDTTSVIDLVNALVFSLTFKGKLVKLLSGVRLSIGGESDEHEYDEDDDDADADEFEVFCCKNSLLEEEVEDDALVGVVAEVVDIVDADAHWFNLSEYISLALFRSK